MKVKLKSLEQLRKEFPNIEESGNTLYCNGWGNCINRYMKKLLGTEIEVSDLGIYYEGRERGLGRYVSGAYRYLEEWIEYKEGDFRIELIDERLFKV